MSFLLKFQNCSTVCILDEHTNFHFLATVTKSAMNMGIFALKSILSDISIVTPALFGVLFVQNIFFII